MFQYDAKSVHFILHRMLKWDVFKILWAGAHIHTCAHTITDTPSPCF